MKKMNKFTAATAAFALPAMVFAPAAHAATFGDELRDAFALPIASAQAGDQDGFKAAEVNKQGGTSEQPGTAAGTDTANTGTEGGENSVSTYNDYEAGNAQARTADNTGGAADGGASDGTGVDQGAGNGTEGGDTGAGDQGSGNPGTGDIDGTTPSAPQPETQPGTQEQAPETTAPQPETQPGTQEQAPETTAPQPETQAPATTESQSPGTVTQQPTATATPEQQTPAATDTTEQAPTVEAAPVPETLPVTGAGVSEMAWAAGAAAALALAAGAVGFRRQEQA